MRPRLPLCVCEGVLLFTGLRAINHGETVGEMTVDGPMIHQKVGEGEEEMSPRPPRAPLSGLLLILFRYSFPSLFIAFMPPLPEPIRFFHHYYSG